MKKSILIAVFILLTMLVTSCAAGPSPDDSQLPSESPTPTEDELTVSEEEASVGDAQAEEGVEPTDEAGGSGNAEIVCDGCPLPGPWLIVYDKVTLDCGEALQLEGEESREDETVILSVGENGQSVSWAYSEGIIELGIISGITEWVHYAGTIMAGSHELTYGASFMGPDPISPKNTLVGQITNEQVVNDITCKAHHPFEGIPQQ